MWLQDALEELDEWGWTLVPEVIPADRIVTIRESVLATVARHRDPEAPAGIGFVPGLIAVEQSFAPYLADPRLLALAGALLGPGFRISYTSAIVNEPGNDRGQWHADWPFNQRNAGHLLPPYPDLVLHLTTLWMLSPFDAESGGTLVVPGSHRQANNPTGENGVDPLEILPGEHQLCGPAGTVAVLDSRLWHATAPNRTGTPRVGLAVRYAPWWLNLDSLRPGSGTRERLVAESGLRENVVPLVPREVWEGLPEVVQPLYQHWVR